MKHDVSILIPTFREALQIEGTIRSAWSLRPSEVIVCDGGSDDGTCEIVEQLVREAGEPVSQTKVIRGESGRGNQLSLAAEHATSSWLVFLHADNRLDVDALTALVGLETPAWGGFRQRIDDGRLRYRLLEWGNGWRGKNRSMLYGDQAMFVSRGLYDRVGGIAQIPLMEDVDFSDRLRRDLPAKLLQGPVSVSARRWQQRGVIRQTLLNWRIQWAYRRGVSPEVLRDWYT